VPGTPVIVRAAGGLGGRGEVVAAPARGEVAVRLGAMHMQVAVADVLLDVHRQAGARARREEPRGRPRREPPGEPAAPAAPPHDRAGARTPDRTLDVRGERADDAVAQLDRFLDESLTAARDVVFVVHGHGTGALRAAVRAHVQGHPAVTRWRAGEASEGGDGVTVLFLDE
jgi:DNA mismatch repair protein MutS2